MLAAQQSAFCGARLRASAAARPAPAAGALLVEAAHKKGGGSSKNKDDSHAQRLGVKLYGDQPCIAGNIIIRQRGTTVRTRLSAEALCPSRASRGLRTLLPGRCVAFRAPARRVAPWHACPCVARARRRRRCDAAPCRRANPKNRAEL